jgi:hypothetical protein
LNAKTCVPLRIETAHHVLDGAVFPGRVHRLKNQQDRPAVLSVEQLLEFDEPLDAALEPADRLAFAIPWGCIRRIVAVQVDRFARPNTEAVATHACTLMGARRVASRVDEREVVCRGLV